MNKSSATTVKDIIVVHAASFKVQTATHSDLHTQ